MTRPELLKKLDDMLDLMARNGEWGSIEIELQNGQAVRIRKSTTEKIFNPTENNRGKFHRQD